MGFIETLNKYGKTVPFQKTTMYKEIHDAKKDLESLGLSLKIKTIQDLFAYEVICNSLKSQRHIENAYEFFLNQNYDLLNYLNYDEKRKMFVNDLEPTLTSLPHFYDEESQTKIYIPHLESFMNQKFITDYQIILLKQHQDYLKNYKVSKETPYVLYGQNVMTAGFSSLEVVYEDERHICFYYDQLSTIYIYQKSTFELLNSVVIPTTKNLTVVDIDDVKMIAHMIETYQYSACLALLKDKGLISEKIYNKILKIYK